MLRKFAIFVGAAAAAYVIVAGAFWLNCLVGGHNFTEATYAGWVAIVLPVAAGFQAVYLPTLR